jgi:outer membrane protein assembly factor BamA
VDSFSYAHRTTAITAARTRLLAISLFVLAALAADARAAAGRSLFDWARRGTESAGEGANDVAIDPEVERKKLEPFYGSTIDSIVVRGNDHTKPITILREMVSRPGGVLDERLVRRDEAYLRGLGYFAAVSMTAEQAESGKCRLVVTVAERSAVFMRLPYPVVNYDFQRGVSYGATWKIKNFRGLGEDLGVSVLARHEREEVAGFFWNSPWFFGRRLNFRFDANAYRRIDQPVNPEEEYLKRYAATGIGIGLPLTQDLMRQLWFKTNVSIERRESRLGLVDPSGVYSCDFHYQNYVATGAELEFDSRDDHISPFNGMRHRLTLRRLTTVAGPAQDYIFYGFSDYFYLPTGEYRTFVVGVDGDIREGDTPTYLEMKLGGVRDVRGFRDDDLRGTVKIVSTLQYRARIMGTRVLEIPIIGRFDVTVNWVAFIDNGALMYDIRDANHERFYTTGGVGVEIISPFRDLFRLEMATDGTNSPAFYMTAGTDF